MADTVTPSLTDLQTKIRSATILASGDLENASPPQLAPVKVAILSALNAIYQRLSVIEPLIDEITVGGTGAGIVGPVQTTSLTQQSAYIRESDALRTTRAYLMRINQNIKTIAG